MDLYNLVDNFDNIINNICETKQTNDECIHFDDKNLYKYNIRGTIIYININKINNIFSTSLFYMLYNNEFNTNKKNNIPLIDRDPMYISYMLNYIRYENINYIGNITNKNILYLIDDANYYGLKNMSISLLKINKNIHSYSSEYKNIINNILEKHENIIKDNINSILEPISSQNANSNDEKICKTFDETNSSQISHVNSKNELLSQKQGAPKELLAFGETPVIKPKVKSPCDLTFGETNNIKSIKYFDLNIGGTKTKINIDIVFKWKDTKLFTWYNTNETIYYVDRNPDYITMILNFLNNNKMNNFEINHVNDIKAIINEFIYLGLPIPKEFSPVRFHKYLLDKIDKKIKLIDEFERKYYCSKNKQENVLSLLDNTLIDYYDIISEFTEYIGNPYPTILNNKTNYYTKNIEIFFDNFNIITKNLLHNLKMNNIFIAGGIVSKCILHQHTDDIVDEFDIFKKDTFQQITILKNQYSEQRNILINDLSKINGRLSYRTKRSISQLNNKINILNKILNYQKNMCDSDIDIFLYDIDEKNGFDKIIYIYDVIKNNTSEDILIYRTTNCITFYTQKIKIQIILRLYRSPKEILMGFDVDSCCLGYDGNKIYTNYRGLRSILGGFNIVDEDRQSTTYEYRLLKYSQRNYKVAIPGFNNIFVDNGIYYDKNIKMADGLATLLICEREFNDILYAMKRLTKIIKKENSDYDITFLKIIKNDPNITFEKWTHLTNGLGNTKIPLLFSLNDISI